MEGKLKLIDEKVSELTKNVEDRKLYISKLRDSIRSLRAEIKFVEKSMNEELGAIQAFSQSAKLFREEVKENDKTEE